MNKFRTQTYSLQVNDCTTTNSFPVNYQPEPVFQAIAGRLVGKLSSD
ncbi:MAG: hypothetical protein V3V22_01765 [Methylococcales bacterium]